MKHLAVLVLSVSLASGADFTNGQAARIVIGQPTFTQQSPDASDSVLGGASGLAYANGMLFVADSNRVGASPENNRVLIFNLPEIVRDPTMPPPDGQRCAVCTGTAGTVLGQPDFTKFDVALTQNGMRQPTAVASNGVVLAVSDTDNNRVLIWKTIPSVNNAPADIVLGQPDFTTNGVNTGTGDPRVPSQKTLRGPQGVWIQNGKLFVADTQNHRVLIWNSIPTSNFQAADVVLGQPDFSTAQEPDLTKKVVNAQANTLLNPVSVASDGTRLYVADLGHNRALIWNSIPTSNQAPADIVVGQPDMTSAVSNNSSALCQSNGTDSTTGNPTYPTRCAATLDFPRYALGDGKRLFIADGGNDRILVYNSLPTQNGQAADVILGQVDGEADNTSDNANPLGKSSSDSMQSPMSLAWDGMNLYASDPINRRVLVFTVGAPTLPITAVRNAASRDIYAVGTVTLGGTVKEGDDVTITIDSRDYKYTVVKDDTLSTIVAALTSLINAGNGDASVLATASTAVDAVLLTSRVPGEPGNSVTYSAKVSDTSQITVNTGGATLAGGHDAAKIAPGTLITLLGDNLADSTASAPTDSGQLPKELAGVSVYFDGMQAPLTYVGPQQINAQLPFEVNDATSVSAYVRTKRRDGSVTVSTAVGVPVITANPGIFAGDGTDPRPAVAMHGSSQASGTVSVDGSAKAGDIATITIEDRSYTYTVQDGDTLASVRDALINLVNQDPKVYAFAAGLWTRIRIRARVEGPEGNGIPFTAKANDGGQVILTATNSALCCANVAGSLVTPDNPAVPGETITVLATGLGIVQPDEAKFALNTGVPYTGPVLNQPNESVSSLAGGKTANVLFAGMKQNAVGVYQVDLELNSDLPTDPAMQLTIAQGDYVSNIVTIPILNPNPSTTSP